METISDVRPSKVEGETEVREARRRDIVLLYLREKEDNISLCIKSAYIHKVGSINKGAFEFLNIVL